MKEEWVLFKTNKMNPYSYWVSNLGKIKKVNSLTGEEEEARQYLGNAGYYQCGTKDFVHRVVAKAFCEGYGEGKQVNHIDGDKLNNRADNLEWVTGSENMKHAKEHGLINIESEKRKAQCRINRLKADEANRKPIVQLTYDLEFVKGYISTQEASLITGIDDSSISRALITKKFGAGGYRWVFKEEYDSGEYKETLQEIGALNGRRKVGMYDTEGNLLKEFSSVKEAQSYGFKLRDEQGLKKTRRGSIRRCLKTGEGTYLGYKWKYITE